MNYGYSFLICRRFKIVFEVVNDACRFVDCLQKYLTKYNYIGNYNPDPQLAQLRMADPDAEFRMAVKNFQRFAGLNMTGKLYR